MSGRIAPRPDRSVARQDAFTLVALAIFVTVLNVLVAAALPLWTQQIKRDKEEELIFRGLQYAEAIRLFQKRAGRYPVRLEELLEIQPRSIRQLWKDPMTEDGKWELIVAAGTGQQGQGQRQGQGTNLVPGSAPDQNLGSRRRRGRRGRQDETVTVGPISGVHSKSKEKAIKVFQGGSTYDSWIFTADIIPVAPTAPGEIIPSLNSKWVGRPFPEGIEPTGGTGIEDTFGDDERQNDERGNRRRRRPNRNNRGDSG